MALQSETNGHINIGSGEQTTVTQIFENLSAEIGYQKKPIYKPERKGDVKHIYLNVEKARANLGWTAHMNLQNGLRETVNLLRSNKEVN